MCEDCGCSSVGTVTIQSPTHIEQIRPVNQVETHTHDGHTHDSHSHNGHIHDGHTHTHTLTVHQGILAKNDRLAAASRDQFQAHGTLVLNVVSSPGAGKTALIERLAQAWPHQGDRPLTMGVIVGDLATDNDAQRLRQAGANAVQITTGNACHLEAAMVARALPQLPDWQTLDLLVIENVGNLVCPASYDLGEALRVVVLSTTEGEDKPLKYPTMFKSADVVLLNKVDVAAAVGCDV
ncbi:MAG: hydrogenase nickel incorporation protein HypB, partial [Cyanobacteria bacterium]|nr:hydrogenase nickel incorporation protein HypB [Cyanobacteriota bacterium]